MLSVHCTVRFILFAVLLGFLVPPASAQDSYFIHIADPHVSFYSASRWETMLDEILLLDPPPDLVVCSGDLVPWGAGSTGEENYDFLLDVPAMSTVDGNHYVSDASHSIPIFFTPGNHDYRTWLQDTDSLQNYLARIHATEYYHTVVADRWAIFSINSGLDVFNDIEVDLPEGEGLYTDQVAQWESDLDGLDGVADGQDSSGLHKIVFMHHPHQWPGDQMCKSDGAISEYRPEFMNICETYDVGWALYGHLHPDSSIVYDLYCDAWNGSGTKCVVAVSAYARGFRREWADGTGEDVVLFAQSPVTTARRAGVLHSPRPNPFQPSTTIAFELAQPATGNLQIFDVRGHYVATLAEGLLPAGYEEIRWSGRDDRGRTLPSGVYHCRLKTAGLVETRRLVLIR